MANDNHASLLTHSQENMVMAEVDFEAISNLDQFFNTPEPLEEKYDISDLPAPQQHQQQQDQAMPLSAEEFPGQYDFELVPVQHEDTKSWTYSQKLRKVFIEMERTLPVRIKCIPMCSGLYINAVMAYCQPTHRSDPVTRCHNHIALSKSDVPVTRINHVLSCKHPNAIYRKTNEHCFVVVPLGAPQPGSDSVQMDFMFHCKNSCATGINRRLTEVIFNLENGLGEVLGRRKLLVRICSCPKRDRDKEERPLRESAPKKRKICPGEKYMTIFKEQPQLELEPEVFTFSARIYGRDNYEMLKKIAWGLMSETMERTGQQAIKHFMDEIRHMR